MPGKMIVALLTVLLVAVFAVQNSAPTTIDFLMFDWSVSKALIIIIAAVAGCLVGLIFSMTRSFKQGKEVRHIQKDKSSADAALKEREIMLEQQKARIEQQQSKLEQQETLLRQQQEKIEQQAAELKRQKEKMMWQESQLGKPTGRSTEKSAEKREEKRAGKPDVGIFSHDDEKTESRTAAEKSQKPAETDSPNRKSKSEEDEGLFEKWKDFIKS